MFFESIDEIVCDHYECDANPSEYVAEFKSLNLRLSQGRHPLLEAPGVIHVGAQAPVVWLNNGHPEIAWVRWSWQDRDSGCWVSHVRTEAFDTPYRCLILASRFHLSADHAPGSAAGRREDVRFSATDGPSFCLGGVWRLNEAARPQGFAMLTRAAGADMAHYAQRQPIVIPRERWGLWLDGNASASFLYRPEFDHPQYAQIRAELAAAA